MGCVLTLKLGLGRLTVFTKLLVSLRLTNPQKKFALPKKLIFEAKIISTIHCDIPKDP